MTTSHSTPWRVSKKYDEDIVSADEEKTIARVFYSIPTTNAARKEVTDTAAHIVRCVNCHYALLAALQSIANETHNIGSAHIIARAAILKATS